MTYLLFCIRHLYQINKKNHTIYLKVLQKEKNVFANIEFFKKMCLFLGKTYLMAMVMMCSMVMILTMVSSMMWLSISMIERKSTSQRFPTSPRRLGITSRAKSPPENALLLGTPYYD